MRNIKTTWFIICFCLLLSFNSSAIQAQETEIVPSSTKAETILAPEAPSFTHINYIALSLEIASNGQVNIACTVLARDCTAVEQRLTLQWWDGRNWMNMPGATWTVKDNGNIGWFSDNSWNVGPGSYRVVNYVIVYDGTNSVEEFEHLSIVATR